MTKTCPKAENTGGRFCPACWPDVVQEDMDQLDRLGDCLQTLAETRELLAKAEELEGEPSLAVTTAQLRSWAFLCHHIALWTPEKLAEAAKCQGEDEA
jgi:hypothetical protein